jgi:hypothetical protein
MRAGFTITPEALANAISEYVGPPAVTGGHLESALTVRFGAKEAANPKGNVRLFLATGRAL